MESSFAPSFASLLFLSLLLSPFSSSPFFLIPTLSLSLSSSSSSLLVSDSTFVRLRTPSHFPPFFRDDAHVFLPVLEIWAQIPVLESYYSLYLSHFTLGGPCAAKLLPVCIAVSIKVLVR